MNISIEIDEQFKLNPQLVEQALQTTFQFINNRAQPPAINVIITDENQMQQLNHQFRGINAPTDVLSFENTPDPDFPQIDPPGDDYLGDIVIAYPVAQKQAQAHGHSTLEEIALLAVHGALHLLGFDHDTPENKQRMWAVQQQIMAQLGLSRVQPTET
jgi:probable rRNA maturation factor